ncbi:serpin family protein [Sandaracinus amylolyticus]|uniref:serpin family protein n=1 Tax=Sandaracinus amylolyticus TaxID=927083 RepID=UPI00094659D7|nr:serpin family protein [Sandaracinus amylolyticus]
MTKRIVLALLLALAGCGGPSQTSSSTSTTPATQVTPADPADARAFATATSAFGLDVWRALRARGETGNLAISPASLSTALAMTYGGARGETATAMQRTLHLATDPDATMPAAGALVRAWNAPRETYTLAVANRLFAEDSYAFRDAYLAATRDHFGAEAERLDFVSAAEASRAHINEWVSSQTRERIRELLPSGSIDPLTRLVLVNAVYFHGRWQHEFDRARTEDLPFFANGGEASVAVPTMHARGGRYGEDEGVQILELPYTGDELAMMIVLPRERDGLAAVEETLDATRVEQWAGRVTERHDVDVRLPRFRIETGSLALRTELEGLGMAIAFSDRADLSGMSADGAQALAISDVYHRVFVEVNEEGTEAAAATGVVVAVRSMPANPPPSFHADHPFLFFLRDTRSGAILFAGRVVDPR